MKFFRLKKDNDYFKNFQFVFLVLCLASEFLTPSNTMRTFKIKSGKIPKFFPCWFMEGKKEQKIKSPFFRLLEMPRMKFQNNIGIKKMIYLFDCQSSK